ncbi:MAG: DUF418 domain-containing protein [Saprospiraceae bacterium]
MTTIQPTGKAERINSVDVIRGVSLLGILLMNIVGFGLYKAYMDPTNSGGSTGWNLNVWWITNMFFEGTMRGMFSMLFGAGVVLFTSKAIESSNGVDVTDTYFRRLLWQLLFGIIHAYLLLWSGEILYAYAIVGMFVYSFRKVEPRNLIIGSSFIFVLATCVTISDYYSVKNTFEKSAAAKIKKNSGQTLSADETKDISKWDEKLAEEKVTPEQFNKEIAALNKGYWSIVAHKAPENQFMQTIFFYRLNFLDIFAMMLMGIAFLRNGILTASRSRQFYWIMVVIGYSVGLTTNYFEVSHIIANNFDVVAYYFTYRTYHLGRIFTTLGHIALIMLFVRSGWLPLLQRALAAVGQMAFTNYIMTSVICNFYFLGYGFAMFGKLQRFELYYVVFSVWTFQLIASPIWLNYFRFGPLEWGWRSLTYWKLQPFKKTNV